MIQIVHPGRAVRFLKRKGYKILGVVRWNDLQFKAWVYMGRG